MNVGTLTIFLGVTTSGINKAIRDVNRAERAVVTSAGRMSEAMLATARVMTQFITFPAAILGAISAKAFADFEYNLSKVTGLVGIASDKTKAWGDEIKDLASVVGKSANELSEALYFVTTGGIRGAETMEVLTISAKAAAAGLGETQQVADLIVSAMNAYGKENLSAARAGDILIASVREGKAEASALAQSMGIVLPVASKLGVTFDQVGGAMAAMTRTGTKAATAGMQTRMMLTKMINPTKQSAQQLVHLGSSFEELRNIIGTEGIIPALIRVNELTKEYGLETMARIFPNIRALAGILDILGENLEENLKAQEAITNSAGALNKAFDIVSGTFKFKVNQFVAQMKTLFMEVGSVIADIVIPIFNKMIDTVRGMVSGFQSMTNAKKEFIVKTVMLSAALGPIIILMQILRKSLIAPLIVLYTKLGHVIFKVNRAYEKQVADLTAVTLANRNNVASQTANIASTISQTKANLAMAASYQALRDSVLSYFTVFAVSQAGVATKVATQFQKALPVAVLTRTEKYSLLLAVMANKLKALGAWLLHIGKMAAVMIGKFAMIGGVVAIIGIVVTALYGWLRKLWQVDEAQKAVKEASVESARAYYKESFAFEKLVKTATNDLATKEMRIEAVKRLNAMAPAYLHNLTEENIQTERGKQLIDAYTESLKRKADAQAYIAALAKLEERRIEDLATGANMTLTWWERAEAIGIAATVGIKAYWYNWEKKEQKAIAEKIKRTTEEYERLYKIFTEGANKAKYAITDLKVHVEYFTDEIRKAEANHSSLSETVVFDLQNQIKHTKEALSYYKQFAKAQSFEYEFPKVKGSELPKAIEGNSWVYKYFQLDRTAEDLNTVKGQLDTLEVLRERLKKIMSRTFEINELMDPELTGFLYDLTLELEGIDRVADILGKDTMETLNQKISVLEGAIEKIKTRGDWFENAGIQDVIKLLDDLKWGLDHISENELFKKIADEEELAERRSELLGESYNKNAERLAYLRTVLLEWANDQNKALDNEKIKALSIEYINLAATQKKVKNTMKSIAEMTRDLNFEISKSVLANQLFGESYDLLAEQTKIYKKYLEDILDRSETLEGVEKDLADSRVQDYKKQYDLLNLIIQIQSDYNDKLGEAADAAIELNDIYKKQYGVQNEVANAIERANTALSIMSLYKKMPWLVQPQDLVGLEELRDIIEELEKLGPEAAAPLKKLKELAGEITVSEIMKDMGFQIDDANKKALYFSDNLEDISIKLSIYGNALRRLRNMSTEAFDDEQMKSWAAEVENLTKEYRDLNFQMHTMSSMLEGSTDLLLVMSTAIFDVENAFERMGRIVISTVEDIIKVLLKKLIIEAMDRSSTEESIAATNRKMLKEMEAAAVTSILGGVTVTKAAATAGDTASTVINTASTVTNTAATVANTVASGTNAAVKTAEAGASAANATAKAAETGASFGPLMILMIPLFLGVVMSALVSMKKARNMAKMAEGGIVPQGYGNDKYPALLSSGEMVIPPKKLPELESRNVEINLYGEWVMKGRDMVYIVRDEERRMSNTFRR